MRTISRAITLDKTTATMWFCLNPTFTSEDQRRNSIIKEENTMNQKPLDNELDQNT